MTGSVRSESSNFIYRKDELDNLETQSKREEFKIKPIIKSDESIATEEPLVESKKIKKARVESVAQKSIIKPKAPKKRIVKGGKY